MKKIYLIVFSTLIITYSFSQIQGIDLNPTIGETFTLHNTNYNNPNISGNNSTWDLSNMTSLGSYEIYIEPANSDLSITNTTVNYANQNFNYALYNDTIQEIYGITIGPTVFSFSNPMKTLEFPINNSLNFTDEFSATYTSQGTLITRTGDISIMYDGQGILSTPEGIFQDVYRVKSIQLFTDEYAGGTINYSITTYFWYKAGFHSELASVTTATSSSQGTMTYGSYTETNNLGLPVQNSAYIRIFPNPTSSEIQLSLCSAASKIEIINVSGLVQKEIIPVSLEPIINLEELNSGVYFIKIHSSNNQYLTTKIIKK